jgi:hypothetical protein
VASTIGIAIRNNDIAVFPKWFCNYTKKEMTRFFKNPVAETLPKNFIARTYDEPHFYYSPVAYTNNLNLHGYFQCEAYFKHCESIIRFHFEPTETVVATMKDLYKDVLDKRTCSIHVRRGDYTNNPVHDVCDIGYYNRAIEQVKSRTDVDEFLVFSDDITWCKDKFKGNYTFVDGNLDVEDMFLMSMCKNHIIANSSFSWWGSWLNNNPSKITVAPLRWFGTDINAKDVYTQNMIKI